jgi:hypothetical protein
LGTNRTLVESAIYTRQYAKIAEGNIARLDEVLAGLIWSISESPEKWPPVPGFRTTRLAKSDGYGNSPKVRIWFRILNQEETELRYIELYD